MTRSRKDHKDFVLEQILDKKVRDYTRQRNAAAWKYLLSVEDYVTREHVLGLSKITCSDPNRLVVFGLKLREHNDELLCSCEVLIRKSWRYTKTGNGGSEVHRSDVLSGCIGGVYTYEENRGRGLATIMIDILVERLKTDEFLGADGFTFLYSEVGDFYVRNGFKSFNVDLINLPLSYNGAKYASKPEYELIKYNEFKDLFKLYNEHFDRDMRRKAALDGIDRISINPSADYVDWFHLRAKFFGVKLFDEKAFLQCDFEKESLDSLSKKFASTEPVYFGVKCVCPKSGKLKGFLVWQYEYGYNKKANKFENYTTLVKSFVDDENFGLEEVTLGLIECMKEYLEADHGTPQMSNFYKIAIWESEIPAAIKKILINRFKCVHGLENSSRSAILYNNKDDNEKLKLGRIIWENNTKLSWF